MKTTNQPITITALVKTFASMTVLALLIGILSLPGFARRVQGTESQNEHKMHHEKPSGKDVLIGKKEVFHFTKVVKVGEVALQPGMYQVQQVAEGGEHYFVFKEVGMPAGYRMFNTPIGKEVARLTCTVESVNQSVNNTKITLRTSAAGVKEVSEIQIAGETIKHIL